jgi:lantibiotic modifying enzyme
MGAGLSSGYTGTALFLAQVGVLTGADKYCELARDAIRPIPQLLEVLAGDLESTQLVGPGFHGLGGISYGLSRLSTLLADSDLTNWLASSLQLTEQLVPDLTEFPSYVEGAAGGLAAMQAIAGIPAADRLRPGPRPTSIGATLRPATAGAPVTPGPHWPGRRPVYPRTSTAT